MVTQNEYALMAGNVYSRSRPLPENTLPIPNGWALINGMDIEDPATGFMARVYVRGSEIVIAYAGTTPGPQDWLDGNIPGWLVMDLLRRRSKKRWICMTR
jgi:hypothetical protein